MHYFCIYQIYLHHSVNPHQDLEARKIIPEGALDRFKKQSRAAHGEPLKFLQMLQNALDVGIGVDIDDFRQPPPSPRVPPRDELGKRHTLILTSDEEPSQTAPEFISTLHMFANHEFAHPPLCTCFPSKLDLARWAKDKSHEHVDLQRSPQDPSQTRGAPSSSERCR